MTTEDYEDPEHKEKSKYDEKFRVEIVIRNAEILKVELLKRFLKTLNLDAEIGLVLEEDQGD